MSALSNLFAHSDAVRPLAVARPRHQVLGVEACAAVKDKKPGEIKKVVGTGFFVNDKGFFITAAHNFDNWELFYKNEDPAMLPLK